MADKINRLEKVVINQDFNFSILKSISTEARQKLNRYKPKNICSRPLIVIVLNLIPQNIKIQFNQLIDYNYKGQYLGMMRKIRCTQFQNIKNNYFRANNNT